MTTTALNALSRAASAYLRSAMHQPVQWHEWGDEAFEEARRDNKPICSTSARCGVTGATSWIVNPTKIPRLRRS